ncbi:MAG: cobalt-precorrin-5B (C(1))-methyltransferase [Magnetococcales bacterium]|nr:cobalt-precorrin-5B (C(1))-methyltransferase [Magnetococcales bacterium]
MKRGESPQRGKRTGFTTGACAAAAARAAITSLRNGTVPQQVAVLLPNGAVVTFAVAEGSCTPTTARCVVIKDAGDDPDCTHGARLTAVVQRLPDPIGAVMLRGGEGVGVVTRPGLGTPVGEPAINPTPRANILENIRAAAGTILEQAGLEVTLSIPGGEELARRTLNARLGITGGLSILGTTGIVYPYSTAAYKEAVRQSVHAAAAMGLPAVVLTTGRRTERFARGILVDLPESAFIQMGDFVGAALESVAATGMPQVIVAAMAGKLAKIGQGVANTHAHKVPLDMERVAYLAATVGAGAAELEQIRTGITVRHAADILAKKGLTPVFYQRLVSDVITALYQRLPPSTRLEVLAFDAEGLLLAHIKAPTP